MVYSDRDTHTTCAGTLGVVETMELRRIMAPHGNIPEPQASVMFKKKIVQEHKPTGRMIEYTPLQVPLTSTVCSSFVSILNYNKSSTPVFGYINTLFEYKSTKLAHVQKYNCVPIQCIKSGLWHIPDDSKTTKVTVPITSLSRPLVVAKNRNELWILD